jgi:hypothetical protein
MDTKENCKASRQKADLGGPDGQVHAPISSNLSTQLKLLNAHLSPLSEQTSTKRVPANEINFTPRSMVIKAKFLSHNNLVQTTRI